MRKFVVCLYFFVSSLYAAAQFNDSLTHFAQFAASGNINRTNTGTAYLLTNEARLSIRSKKTTANSSVSWVYGELRTNLTNNDFVTTHDFNLYNKKGDFYYWGLANYTTSFSLKINNQLQSGLGAAYNFVNTASAWLNLSNGLLYERSNLAVNDSVNNNYQTVRNSLRLSYRFVIGGAFTINGSNYLQNALTNGSDYIIRAKNSAGFKLNKWLSFVTSFNYNQFSRTGRETLLLTYGLTAEKYF